MVKFGFAQTVLQLVPCYNTVFCGAKKKSGHQLKSLKNANRVANNVGLTFWSIFLSSEMREKNLL